MYAMNDEFMFTLVLSLGAELEQSRKEELLAPQSWADRKFH